MAAFTDAEWAQILGMVGRIERGEYSRDAFVTNTEAVLRLYKTAYSDSAISGDTTVADRLRRRAMMRDQVELLTRPE